ncbi:hypothetical protein [Sanguibacter sp. 25GB23B1]|uniref:hypothetical protein n=1 Tax=unclassified Sanguibacter TaxID=2645534 RepID=UPI0032AFA572
MKLPSQVAGLTTQEVGFFDVDHERLATWLQAELGEGCTASSPGWASVVEAGAALGGPGPVTRRACIKVGAWSLILTDGPRGTDVGGLPIHVPEVFSRRAIRAVCVDDDGPGYPARILVVHGPDGETPLNVERSIAAAHDGGRWVFETSGTPYDFEDLTAYRHRLKKRRFTSEMLYDYLRRLSVPVDTEPDWSSTILLELTLLSPER